MGQRLLVIEHRASSRTFKPMRHRVAGAGNHAPSSIWRAINGCRTISVAIWFMIGIKMQPAVWLFPAVEGRMLKLIAADEGYEPTRTADAARRDARA
jgi:hypothetical protein